ncbi:MAG: FecR domain-containing protein [Pyrinomonadaceae bacterium]
MRKASESVVLVLLSTVLLVLSFAIVQGQSRERFVVSAKAGGINAVTGGTSVHAKGVSVWQQLTIKDNLESGDVVKTGLDGRVEMLLNPGSYLRVGENSEFELSDNSLDNLELRLIRGTAIVEATGADDSEMLVNITTPHARMAIVRRGLYRVNVLPTDATELIVRKGRVLLADSQTKVKGGRKLIFSGTSFLIAKQEKTDKENLDSLDVWSKQRAETVAQANRRISSRDVTLFMASLNDDWFGRRSLSGRSPGLWVFNSRFGCYTFLPFYFGWGSPYGGAYSNSFYAGSSVFGGFQNRGPLVHYPSGVSSMPGPNGGGTSVSNPSVSNPPRNMPPMNNPSMSNPSPRETRSSPPHHDRGHDRGISRPRVHENKR